MKKEDGFPEWFSPGYKDCMIGQNSTSVITDAKAKGIGDYDSRLMFSAMSKGASGRGRTQPEGQDIKTTTG